MRGTTVRGVLVTLSGIGLAGCASLGGVPGVRSHASDPGSLQVSATMAAAPLDETAWPTEDWWRTFADPQLDRLFATAAFAIFALASFWRAGYTPDANFAAIALPQLLQGAGIACTSPRSWQSPSAAWTRSAWRSDQDLRTSCERPPAASALHS